MTPRRIRSSPATTPWPRGWESAPIRPGTPLTAPTPLFAKLDPAVAQEELDRLEKS